MNEPVTRQPTHMSAVQHRTFVEVEADKIAIIIQLSINIHLHKKVQYNLLSLPIYKCVRIFTYELRYLSTKLHATFSKHSYCT